MEQDPFKKMFENMKRALDEHYAKFNHPFAEAPGWNKYWEAQGWRGRILPRYINIPKGLIPYGSRCYWYHGSKNLCGISTKTGYINCQFMTKPCYYCPCFRENYEYTELLDQYHKKNGSPEEYLLLKNKR